MAGPVRLKVTGVDEVARDLSALGSDVANPTAALDQIGTQGARVVGGFAPRRSGRLASTTRAQTRSRGVTVFSGGGGVDYASVQNYGWPARNIPAKRYLQRADGVLEPYATRTLDREIDRLAAKRGF